MPRKTELPKISMVTVSYNGNREAFESFMESMITDYLNSDKLPEHNTDDFIGKVENFEKPA